ncbi:uncharacterized protein Tco025E_08815 [Trypanosoma conorhini]|uniref:Uncharacterized protein n=1 Tax=Trypanosoma conorhini TaxID=83891 RepID=A0A422N4K1_9TRYP|nr:uncharacterized protein Tco025E_08815 [Trypanosoma conorhini]RNF00386.1 hypothetical protein Tco025E_08815 [Trypanosoma conorhini]
MFSALARQTAVLRAAYVPLAAAYAPAATSSPSAVLAAATGANTTAMGGGHPAAEPAGRLPAAVVSGGGGGGGGGDTLPLVGDPRVHIWRDEEALLRASLGRLEAERELARMRHRCEDELRSLRDGLRVREGQVARLVRRVITRAPAKRRRGCQAAAGSDNGGSSPHTAVTDVCEKPGALLPHDQAGAGESCGVAPHGRPSRREKGHGATLEEAEEGGNDEGEAPNDDGQQLPGTPPANGEDAAADVGGDNATPPLPPLPPGMEPQTWGGAGGAGTNPAGEAQPAAPTDGGLAKDARQPRGRRTGATKKSGSGGTKGTAPKERSPAKNTKASARKPAKPRARTQRRTAPQKGRASTKKAQPKRKGTTRPAAPKRRAAASKKRPQQRKQPNKTNKTKQGSRSKSSGRAKKPTSTRRRK